MMIEKRLKRTQEIMSHFNPGITYRRIYILTRYQALLDKFNKTRSETDKTAMLSDQAQLPSVEEHAAKFLPDMRKQQTKYLIEYEAKSDIDGSLKTFSEEVYFLSQCSIDTFESGWADTLKNNMELKNSLESLLYEVGEYFTLNRFDIFYIRNIKSIK